MKILSVFGTRPEAIKMAPVIQELQRFSGRATSLVSVTAQHRQMLDQVLTLFELKPDYDLNVMQDNQSPTQAAAVILTRLEPILLSEKPDWVLVQGDTTTAMAASVAAFYARVRVGHIEAGLRTNNKWQPFPEEINRRLVGVTADLHFAPTAGSRLNLLREGVPPDQVVVTGNPVIDALHQVTDSAFKPEGVLVEVFARLASGAKLILVTAHRRENFGRPLEEICLALREVAEIYGEAIHIVYPVHLNPNVQKTVYRLLGGVSNITLTAPLDYLALVKLMKAAYIVLTDSGGIQEEAPAFGKPVLVLREVTERPEAVEAGTVCLVGTDRLKIVRAVRILLEESSLYQEMSLALNPYGDGHAASRIIGSLLGEPVTEWECQTERSIPLTLADRLAG